MLPVPEYMKIREYVIGLIRCADASGDLKIEAESELCRKFNVSRVTVRYALKKLVEDGYLVPRRGLGTFINPAKVSRQPRFKSIGLLFDNGMRIHHSDGDNHTAAIKAVNDLGFLYRFMFPPADLTKSKEYIKVVKAELDALIWFNPPADTEIFIRRLLESGLPILLIQYKHSGFAEFNRINLDEYGLGKKLATFMFSCGHKRILHLDVKAGTGQESETYKGYRDAMREADNNVDDTLYVSPSDINRQIIETKFDDGRGFTAIYSSAGVVPAVLQNIKDMWKRIPEDVSYLVFKGIDPYFFNGKTPAKISYPINEITEACKTWLKDRLLLNKDDDCFQIDVSSVISPGETVRKL